MSSAPIWFDKIFGLFDYYSDIWGSSNTKYKAMLYSSSTSLLTEIRGTQFKQALIKNSNMTVLH